MSGKPNLSVLLTTHAEFDHLEFLLQTLLRFQKPDFEIILVNDDADSEVADALRTIITLSEDERVFFFEHLSKHGRGQSLNEALLQANAPHIWAPLRADRLNEQLLADTIRRFKNDPAAFWILDANLPNAIPGWINAAGDGELPDDSCFIWNRNVLLDGDFFFNPFLNTLACSELALRLVKQNAWQRTDPFFVLAEDQFSTPGSDDILDFYFSIYRVCSEEADRKLVLSAIDDLKHKPTVSQLADDLILQARKLLAQGDAVRALDAVNRLLKKTPEHKEANRLKITLLEKLRRHVEAAELKHSMQSKPQHTPEQKTIPRKEKEYVEDEEEIPEETTAEIELSVIIPTTGDSRALLQQTLTSLEKAVKNIHTELIVIDNASIDDTFEFLGQLEEQDFLHCKVITNQSNKGFAASVNQGLDKAAGKLAMVMHNDVLLSESCVEKMIDAYASEGCDIIGPSVINPDEEVDTRTKEITKADKLDSCCFLLSGDTTLRFDTRYELCFYETDDFFKKAAEADVTACKMNSAVVEHLQNQTISAMGLKIEPDLKWKNADRFLDKWDTKSDYPQPLQCSPPECFEMIGLPPDPWNPDEEWLSVVEKYLTSEVRTIIQKTDWKPSELFTIVTTLLFADQRDLLRILEDRLDELDIPEVILMLFINFYYRRNIFSRCKHYLAKTGRYRNPVFDMYRLRMAVANKEVERAAKLLEKLMNIYSCNPELYKLAGDIHMADGNDGEAKSFYALANQLDPYRFPAEEEAFELRL